MQTDLPNGLDDKTPPPLSKSFKNLKHFVKLLLAEMNLRGGDVRVAVQGLQDQNRMMGALAENDEVKLQADTLIPLVTPTEEPMPASTSTAATGDSETSRMLQLLQMQVKGQSEFQTSMLRMVGRPSVGNSSSQVPSKAMDGVLKELEKICAWNLCMRTLPGLANSMFTEGRDNKCKELVVVILTKAAAGAVACMRHLRHLEAIAVNISQTRINGFKSDNTRRNRVGHGSQQNMMNRENAAQAKFLHEHMPNAYMAAEDEFSLATNEQEQLKDLYEAGLEKEAIIKDSQKKKSAKDSRTNPKQVSEFKLWEREAGINEALRNLDLPYMAMLFPERVRLFHAIFVDTKRGKDGNNLSFDDPDHAFSTVGGNTVAESKAKFASLTEVVELEPILDDMDLAAQNPVIARNKVKRATKMVLGPNNKPLSKWGLEDGDDEDGDASGNKKRRKPAKKSIPNKKQATEGNDSSVGTDN